MASAMSPTIKYSKFIDASLRQAPLDAVAGVDERCQHDKGCDGDSDEKDFRHNWVAPHDIPPSRPI